MSAPADSAGQGGLGSVFDGRVPPVPLPVQLHLERAAPLAFSQDLTLGGLVEAARTALHEALGGTGERRGAFQLLAADAFVTYACEAASRSEDPRAELLGLIAALLTAGEEAR